MSKHTWNTEPAFFKLCQVQDGFLIIRVHLTWSRREEAVNDHVHVRFLNWHCHPSRSEHGTMPPPEKELTPLSGTKPALPISVIPNLVFLRVYKITLR